jgi:hypothetical protein
LDLKPRRLVPELLDSLPADHPDAILSRADLGRINALMGNHRWLERQVEGHRRRFPEGRVIELGAGDGTLARRLHRRFPSLRYVGLDLALRPDTLPPPFAWLQGDLFLTLPTLPDGPPGPEDAVLANLFLHHFTDAQLRELGPQLRSAGLLAVCEPWRHPWGHVLGRLLGLTGIHPVTRHDLHASVDAGFAGDELALLLGLPPGESPARRDVTCLGAYRWCAWPLPKPPTTS